MAAESCRKGTGEGESKKTPWEGGSMGHAKTRTNKCKTDVITCGPMEASPVVVIGSIVRGARGLPLSKRCREIRGWEIL